MRRAQYEVAWKLHSLVCVWYHPSTFVPVRTFLIPRKHVWILARMTINAREQRLFLARNSGGWLDMTQEIVGGHHSNVVKAASRGGWMKRRGDLFSLLIRCLHSLTTRLLLECCYKHCFLNLDSLQATNLVCFGPEQAKQKLHASSQGCPMCC